jgi:hypothetical protein
MVGGSNPVRAHSRRHRRLARRFTRTKDVSTVMDITKCRIWVPPVNQFTVTPRALRQSAGTSDWMVRAGLYGERAWLAVTNFANCETTRSMA